MNQKPSPKSALGLVGLAALTVYILACTSFSPDDSKVLYPTYDLKAQEFGVALYDRATGKSSTLFVAQQPAADEDDPELAFLRPQWLADGRHILVGWARGGEDDVLDLAVLPHGYPGPTRLIHLDGLPEAAGTLSLPLATAGDQLFLRGGSNALVRVDLLTGEFSQHEIPRDVTPYASPAGDQVGYIGETGPDEDAWEFGHIDTATGALKPVTKFNFKRESDDGGWLALTPDGKWFVALDEGPDAAPLVVCFENGVEQRRVNVATPGERLNLGSVVVSPAGRIAYASYFRRGDGETNASAGIIELPLPRGEPRRTTLIERLKAEDQERIMYFQPSVSHDGKTLAVASTYLAAGDETIRTDDCALFLIDLTDPQRKITRVPVPRPPADLD